MKTKYAYIAALVLLAFLSVCYYFDKSSKKPISEDPYRIIERLRVENYLLKEGFFHSCDFSFIPLELDQSFPNILGPVNLHDLSENDHTLFLFVNPSACLPCVPEHLEDIKSFAEKNDINVVIGIEGMNEREFNIFVKQHKVELIAYRLPDGFYSGFYINPIVYFLKKGDHIGCFYAPSPSFPSLTHDYFNLIRGII